MRQEKPLKTIDPLSAQKSNPQILKTTGRQFALFPQKEKLYIAQDNMKSLLLT